MQSTHSLREDAVVEAVNFNYDGKSYEGKKVYFQPFVDDVHRVKYEDFADKTYEFILCKDIPGGLYQIKTVIPDKSKENAEPLIQEVLTLVDVKDVKS